jgi:hypothetical protein
MIESNLLSSKQRSQYWSKQRSQIAALVGEKSKRVNMGRCGNMRGHDAGFLQRMIRVPFPYTFAFIITAAARGAQGAFSL